MEEWVDGFGEDSVDLNDDVGEDFVEALDFSSFGGGELITETLVWGGHQRRVDIVEGGVHIVMGGPGDEDDVTLIYYTMEIGGRGNGRTFGEALHVEMSPIWEFACDESTEEGIDVGNLNIGRGQSLTMGIIRVEEELLEYFAGKIRVNSDETAGVCGGGVLKEFGEMLILSC